MLIRLSELSDIPVLKALFDYGRKVQLETGNPNQWEEGYPSIELLTEDINNKESYVLEDEGEIIGSFVLQAGPDPTYHKIDGAWLDDEPYHVVHRLVSSGKKKGLGRYMLEWILDRYDNVRIDTHELNKPMRNLVEELGFTYCGVIYLPNSDPRYAYQRKSQ